MRLEHLLSGENVTNYKGSDNEKYGHRWFFVITFSCTLLQSVLGGLAQLARALAWHARGHRFDPDILHYALWGESSLTY